MNKEHILSVDDSNLLRYEVPEWGKDNEPCVIFLRSWTGKDRHNILKFKDDLVKLYERCLILSIADEAGKQMFTDKDADALLKRNAQVLERIIQAAMQHNGIGAVDDAKKN